MKNKSPKKKVTRAKKTDALPRTRTKPETDTVLESAYAHLALSNRIDSGASWFSTIGGLSILNSFLYLFVKSQFFFIFGLGITQVTDVLAALAAEEIGGSVASLLTGIAFVFSLLVGLGFIWVGRYTRTRKVMLPLAIGGMLYFLDAILLLFFGDWLGVAFHGLALLGIFVGYRALKEFSQLDDDAKAQLQSHKLKIQKVERQVNFTRVLKVVGIFTAIASIIGLLIYLSIKAAGL